MCCFRDKDCLHRPYADSEGSASAAGGPTSGQEGALVSAANITIAKAGIEIDDVGAVRNDRKSSRHIAHWLISGCTSPNHEFS